jgi:5-hydroxyisourate hydrolase
MSKLTTHILDTAQGRPAGAVVIDLFRCTADGRCALGHALTNGDGRCAAPLLADSAFVSGVYELDFHIGDYFARQNLGGATPRFLDVVTLRFGVSDAAADYHVPLLVSPFGYSTYRGS